jgi:glycosyltransferase involved in cell wall biosynthesis
MVVQYTLPTHVLSFCFKRFVNDFKDICTNMKIAINARFIQQPYLEGYGNFTIELFKRVALLLPAYEFHFILDRVYTAELPLPTNCKTIVIGPQARHPLLWHYWFNVKVPRYLKKIKADLFISTDGFCSITTKVPQITIIHDLAFISHASAIKKSHLYYYKKYTPRFIKKSQHIVTVSEFSKNQIQEVYKTDASKISVIYNAAKEVFKPIHWKDAMDVKDKYTEGKEFFVCVSSIHPRKNLITLLKAFSIFKKWLKSEMKLVLVGRLAWKNEGFTKLLANYKYKKDVILTGYLPDEEVARLVASAYCAVYPSVYEGFGVPIIEAMQSDVPIICSNVSGTVEAGGEAAIYFDPTSVEDLSQQMQKIYKDENLRAKHIQWGREQAQVFNWDVSAQKLRQLIEFILIQ